MVKARKITVQSIVEQIAEETNRIYRAIHPDEPIGAITLKIPERGQGSVDMEGEFYERRADARLFYSESHLDTLGVALFLARRKLQATALPHMKLLVLDDVFHSVDASHRERAARLIIDEFKDHQFIITTHDPFWFALLKEAVDSSGIRENVLFKRIASWSLENGPIWGDDESDREYLESDKINTATPADIASRAGRLLEETLKPLCERLRIAVLYRESGRHDLATLWQPFYKKAKEHTGYAAAALTVLDEIDRSDWVRNAVGAHANTAACPVTQAEAKRFAQSVVSLHGLSKCKKFHFLEEANVPEGDWVCKCGALRYPKRGNVVIPQATLGNPVTPTQN